MNEKILFKNSGKLKSCINPIFCLERIQGNFFKINYFLIFRYLENGDRPLRRENPHKYLLYKPTLSQVLVFLASGFKELPANGALLLYLSADGCFSTTKHPEDSKYLISL